MKRYVKSATTYDLVDECKALYESAFDTFIDVAPSRLFFDGTYSNGSVTIRFYEEPENGYEEYDDGTSSMQLVTTFYFRYTSKDPRSLEEQFNDCLNKFIADNFS